MLNYSDENIENPTKFCKMHIWNWNFKSISFTFHGYVEILIHIMSICKYIMAEFVKETIRILYSIVNQSKFLLDIEEIL